MKTCKACGGDRGERFHGRYCWNCYLAHMREYAPVYRKSKPEVKEARNKYAKKYWHSDKGRDYYLRRFYGITLDQKKEIFKKQNETCPICDKALSLNKCATDHDHSTGKVRGLLCIKCNGLLAALDNVQWAAKAYTYKANPPSQGII